MSTAGMLDELEVEIVLAFVHTVGLVESVAQTITRFISIAITNYA